MNMDSNEHCKGGVHHIMSTGIPDANVHSETYAWRPALLDGIIMQRML